MIIRKFFEAAAQGIPGSGGQVQTYNIPYIKDAKGVTPLEFCLKVEHQPLPLINIATEML
jgi:hypothetical protein